MTIKTVRGLIGWLQKELDNAMLEDDIAIDTADENEVYVAKDDSIFARIHFFFRAKKAVMWTYPGEPLDGALGRIRSLIDKNPEIVPPFILKQLKDKFPELFDK